MIKHFMILSSSYSSGTRIALHYVIDEHTSSEMLTAEVKKIKDACGETVSISTHYVETNSDKWDSVPDKDAFPRMLFLQGSRLLIRLMSL